jgi:hypothetical protein
MLWFALFFMLIWVVISVFMDIFRSRDLSGWSKALWTLFIVFLPWLGVFVYLVARGNTMADRRFDENYGVGPMGTYPTPVAASPTGDLTALADLRDRGVIDEAEFQVMKQKVVAV